MRHMVLLLLLAACSTPPTTPPAVVPEPATPTGPPRGGAVDGADPSYVDAIDRWHQGREQSLRSDEGWLTLVNLAWLDDGRTTVGSDDAAGVALPARLPAQVGTLIKQGTVVTFEPVAGVRVQLGDQPLAGNTPLRGDHHAQGPDVLSVQGVSFYLIERGDRVGVRVKDSQAPARTAFTGVPRFPVDPAWRITARLERYAEPRTVSIPNVLGQQSDEPTPGLLVFEHGGSTHRLEPVGDDEGLFLVFADGTSGVQTYGGGRFLSAEIGQDDTVVLDFNKATSPPCAFSDYATCPLPPPQNRLALQVTAGEQYDGPTH